MSKKLDIKTDSGFLVKEVYNRNDISKKNEKGEKPGKYPFTRGIHEKMYRQRLWTMRQYSGFGSAEETNKRFKFLLDHGQTGLSLAFDLPTQTGRDSDNPQSEGEVGRTGVAISSIEDMMACFAAIPLDKVKYIYDNQFDCCHAIVIIYNSSRFTRSKSCFFKRNYSK